MYKMEKREDDLSFGKMHPLERVDYSEEFKDKYKLKTLDMLYKKEIQYGNTVLSEVQIDDNIAKISVKNKTTDEDLCLVKAEFTDVK